MGKNKDTIQTRRNRRDNSGLVPLHWAILHARQLPWLPSLQTNLAHQRGPPGASWMILKSTKTSLFLSFFLWWKQNANNKSSHRATGSTFFLQITKDSRHLRFQQSKELQGAGKRSPHLFKTRLILAIMWDFVSLRTGEFAASSWYMPYKFTKDMIGK